MLSISVLAFHCNICFYCLFACPELTLPGNFIEYFWNMQSLDIGKDFYVFFVRGFKALKQTVKLYYRLGKYEEMMQAYREMLTYIKSAVTRNYSEKCINSIMDFVSGSASQNFGLLQEFYQTTLKALEEAKNEVRGHLTLFHGEFLVKEFKFWLYHSMLCRDYGLKQISSFARFGLTWVNMGEWVRYWVVIMLYFNFLSIYITK